jgi:predicted nucleic acid-binding protein
MVLVDSSVWIEAARRAGDIATKVGLEGLLEEYEASCCGVVLLEVLGGARKQDRERLERMFRCIPYVRTDDSLWERARRLAWKLRDAGQTIPWNDIVVASLALAQGCRVYARDRHFDIMREVLELRLYEPDYGGKFRPEGG